MAADGIRLGVTGGIGSGKSYVCQMLRDHLGIPVYNCDIHARLITLSDPDVISQLSALVDGLYDSEGELVKERLAAYLFASEANAQRINAIIHPAVRNDWREWRHRHRQAPVVALESAILYESGFDGEVDQVLFVDAPTELRIQRTMARDGLTREQTLQRMEHQKTEEARERADFVITNDGKNAIEQELKQIMKKLC